MLRLALSVALFSLALACGSENGGASPGSVLVVCGSITIDGCAAAWPEPPHEWLCDSGEAAYLPCSSGCYNGYNDCAACSDVYLICR